MIMITHQWSLLLILKEQFSTECRKTKTKAITMANHNKRKQHRANEGNTRTCNQCQPRENACDQVAI